MSKGGPIKCLRHRPIVSEQLLEGPRVPGGRVDRVSTLPVLMRVVIVRPSVKSSSKVAQIIYFIKCAEV